ncbi:NADH dehydrogenase [ubiquinone] iron-sulfur protein 6, mitochondrial-like [Uloborus diversus]|uniref:NADH dehydrogenase [ubiquinone] iron-sulfur protein 6, mitochondrial-like n=1 Tax=Uloborus diversus TaxID=327109 RepID=UPI0024092281|nr:NADH dehydrogenase [ubiquinone] iron-sulfur protein 6, mitochondrial-like [Uloborus diversus]
MATSLLRQILPNVKTCNLQVLTIPYSTKLVATKEKDNKITHTGQKFENDDYRMVRFTDREKQVNPNFAIDLINSIPPKPVKERVMWCNGGGGALGHPKVYINLDQPGPKACGYCGLRFVLEHEHH